MKKRCAAALLTALLVVQLFGLSSAAAPEKVHFTAVNDAVLELTKATMPFWSEGYLYVPSTVFSESDELGLSYSRNLPKQTMVFWLPSRENKALVFNLASGTVTDGKGEDKYPAAIVRGSVIFVPAALMAESFDLTYTYLPVTNGYLVRIRNSRAVLKDTIFVDAATSWLEERYEQYLLSKAGEESTPEVPGVQEEGKQLYLCLLAREAEQVAALLDVLEQLPAQAVFYCTLEFLQTSGDLVRRILGTGQGIGLAAHSVEEAAAMNERLFRAANVKTRLVWQPEGGGGNDGLRQAGYCPLETDFDWFTNGLGSYAASASLISRVSSWDGDCSIWLGDNVNATGLEAFIRAARSRGNQLLAITETEG